MKVCCRKSTCRMQIWCRKCFCRIYIFVCIFMITIFISYLSFERVNWCWFILSFAEGLEHSASHFLPWLLQILLPLSRSEEIPSTRKRKRIYRPKLQHQNKLYTYDKEFKGVTHYRCKSRSRVGGRVVVKSESTVELKRSHSCLVTALE